ncbi:rhodanese-like domain-containing protein [Engelhardtia mirabilis]|uniref:Putative adenylyltransferase/sulfurtransferase MoeZ n=1 Tax=Engelhardtia mirabilis TaxID=2528011 RepID=A0A518BFT5_9BACT|nr:putative adenylyltransferase/sulfurtransferase MoeZ [Planctomycetes bacterium Pla133]QDV00170.1 putative adenylyltransferase/sulfurtransferase MoeZ [Planctomycetes bacterium Pla86]
MDFVTLAIAVVALLVAITALKRVSNPTVLEDMRAEGRRRVENLRTELRADIETNRRLLAEVAAGGDLDAEQIIEGRLWNDVSTREGIAMVQSGSVRLLDVRSPQETASGVIPGAQLIPVDQLEERLDELPKDGKPMLVYCAGGGRSAAACEFLSGKGFSGLSNLEGGIGAWTGPVAKS